MSDVPRDDIYPKCVVCQQDEVDALNITGYICPECIRLEGELYRQMCDDRPVDPGLGVPVESEE